jgi:hypothetical protein
MTTSPDEVTEWIDLGSGYDFRWGGSGIFMRCPHRERLMMEEFGGFIPILPTEGGWSMESRVSLTLSPSINMPDCGCHGFITAGRWVSA